MIRERQPLKGQPCRDTAPLRSSYKCSGDVGHTDSRHFPNPNKHVLCSSLLHTWNKHKATSTKQHSSPRVHPEWCFSTICFCPERTGAGSRFHWRKGDSGHRIPSSFPVSHLTHKDVPILSNQSAFPLPRTQIHYQNGSQTDCTKIRNWLSSFICPEKNLETFFKINLTIYVTRDPK